MEPIFSRVRSQKDPCPDLEILTRFLDGQLSEDEGHKLKTHIAICGMCDHLVESGRNFGEARAENARALPEDWSKVERRLETRFHRFLNKKPDFWSMRIVRVADLAIAFLKHPAVAYALAIILLYPAYLGLTLGRHKEAARQVSPQTDGPRPLEGGFGAAPLFDLSPTRSGNEGNVVRLVPNDQSFILSFFVPIRKDFKYSALLTDGEGVPVTTQFDLRSLADRDGFYLICNRQLVRSGQYTLRVTERNPATGARVREFPSFQFRVEL